MNIKKKCKQIQNSADKVREQRRIGKVYHLTAMKTIARPVSLGDYMRSLLRVRNTVGLCIFMGILRST